MSRVIVGSGGGEPPFVSARGLIDGLKALGHEVLHVGASYWGRTDCDIRVPDLPFPELYSYDSVLEKLPWVPDACVAVEPHFFFTGSKPPEVKSAYLALDPHRGAAMWRKLVNVGDYDVVFCAQKYYLPCFSGIRPRLEYLPQAFDERRFDRTMEYPILCDISFIGQSGIAGMEYPYEDRIGRFATSPPANLPNDKTRFAFWENGSFEYAERAEMLRFLCKHFRVRIYTNLWDIEFQRAIQAGAVGFNRSLAFDITMRVHEVMGAGRLLITNELPYQGELFRNEEHCLTYPTFGFNPLFSNFEIECEGAYGIIRNILNDAPKWEQICTSAKEHTWARNTWKVRAQELLNLL